MRKCWSALGRSPACTCYWCVGGAIAVTDQEVPVAVWFRNNTPPNVATTWGRKGKKIRTMHEQTPFLQLSSLSSVPPHWHRTQPGGSWPVSLGKVVSRLLSTCPEYKGGHRKAGMELTATRQITSTNGDSNGTYLAWLLWVIELKYAKPFRTMPDA